MYTQHTFFLRDNPRTIKKDINKVSLRDLTIFHLPFIRGANSGVLETNDIIYTNYNIKL